MSRISTAVAALPTAILLGLACSSSGLKTIVDAGVASGGQAGNTISSAATAASGGTPGPGGAGGSDMGGTGGLSSPDGAGGTNISGTGGAIAPGGSNGSGGTAGSSGTGGTGGQVRTTGCGPICAGYLGCNPGDQMVAFGNPCDNLLGDCPAERECYTLRSTCGPTLCVLPEGVHCSDPLLCNPGDTQIASDYEVCMAYPSPCYQVNLCGEMIHCRYGTDAGVEAATPDAGLDVRTMRTCGNGVLDPGEQCDDGNTNNGDGCSATCQIEAGWNCSTPGLLCTPCGTNACDAGPVGYCGDGILQTNFGEECDLGPLNGVRSEGDCFLCNTDCRIPPCDI